jgi:hypothetical protein
MAGKMTSEVKGLSEKLAAQMKELKPTRRGMPDQRATLVD